MTTLLVPHEQVKAMLLGRIGAGEELLSKAGIAADTGGYGDWIYLFEKWRDHTTAELKAVYEGDDIMSEFHIATQSSKAPSPKSAFSFTNDSLKLGVWKLKGFVERLALAVGPEPLQLRPEKVSETLPQRDQSSHLASVFIVHGKEAGGYLDSIKRFIERLGLRPVILAEQANQGSRTIIEKFEANALEVGFAIALLTPEDSVMGPDDTPPPRPNRARQNVILELGYFMAKLGRKNVIALEQEGVEVPSDILGILYIPLDDSDAWKTLIARELIVAGYQIDPANLLD